MIIIYHIYSIETLRRVGSYIKEGFYNSGYITAQFYSRSYFQK